MRDERKSLLYRYPALGSELADLAEKIADLEGKLQAHYERLGTTLDADRVGGTGPGDPTAEAADYVMRLKSRLDRLYAASEWRLVALGRVEAFLDRLDALERPAVELRYFHQRTWDEVAEAQALSIATVYRLHASALRKWMPKVDSF